VPFVGVTGLVGLKHAHYRGGSITYLPYKKNVPLLQTLAIVVKMVLTETTEMALWQCWLATMTRVDLVQVDAKPGPNRA
jgi:predicted hotdog family 3-hydroxylacyl-ACP dehydratase